MPGVIEEEAGVQRSGFRGLRNPLFGVKTRIDSSCSLAALSAVPQKSLDDPDLANIVCRPG